MKTPSFQGLIMALMELPGWYHVRDAVVRRAVQFDTARRKHEQTKKDGRPSTHAWNQLTKQEQDFISSVVSVEMLERAEKALPYPLYPKNVRKIINAFVCTFGGHEVFRADLDPAIAANPYFEFTIQVQESGTFVFSWTDDDGTVTTAEQSITVTDSIGDRRQLVAALKLLASWGVVTETDGTLTGWGERPEDEALLSINRALLIHLLPLTQPALVAPRVVRDSGMRDRQNSIAIGWKIRPKLECHADTLH